MNDLQRCGQRNLPVLIKGSDSCELSMYSDTLTPKGTATALKRLKNAFPDLGDNFHDVLGERIIEKGFTDKQFMDAVNNVVDNCIYPTPTIAQFLSFDSRVKVLNYEQYLKKNDELHGQASRFYKSVFVPGYDKPFWAHENDINKFSLTLWKDRL
jgi:hypothetical protein